MSCVLCDRSPEAGDLLLENRVARVLLHRDSAVRGHALVASARHVENLTDLTDGEAVEFMRLERLAERALLEVTKTGRPILLKLGIQTPHLHLHIYPVSATLDRVTVQRIIDATVSEPREPGFADAVRERLRRLTSDGE